MVHTPNKPVLLFENSNSNVLASYPCSVSGGEIATGRWRCIGDGNITSRYRELIIHQVAISRGTSRCSKRLLGTDMFRSKIVNKSGVFRLRKAPRFPDFSLKGGPFLIEGPFLFRTPEYPNFSRASGAIYITKFVFLTDTSAAGENFDGL